MRTLSRLARSGFVWLVLLLAGAGAAFGPDRDAAAAAVRAADRVWTRQLDRVATRAEQASLLPVEIDALREQVADVRAAAIAAAAIARNDLADTKKLLAPLELKPGREAAAETDAVKAERARLTEQATVSESQLKQCEVIIARADQLTERLTKLRGAGSARRPAAPGRLAAVARRVAPARAAIQDGAADPVGGAGGVGPRGLERTGLGRAGSHRAGGLGSGDRRLVVAGPGCPSHHNPTVTTAQNASGVRSCSPERRPLKPFARPGRERRRQRLQRGRIRARACSRRRATGARRRGATGCAA